MFVYSLSLPILKFFPGILANPIGTLVLFSKTVALGSVMLGVLEVLIEGNPKPHIRTLLII